MMTKDIIKEVYTMLKNRDINPAGEFDKQGRFYAKNKDLINVRTPSAAWPFSEMIACRTLKYVKLVCEKYNCQTKEDLINNC